MGDKSPFHLVAYLNESVESLLVSFTSYLDTYLLSPVTAVFVAPVHVSLSL